MGSRLKELVVCLVDVSPSMRANLKPLKASLFTLVHSQILFRPQNEVGIFLFGTRATQNVLHDEMAELGRRRQYLHVSELKPLAAPDKSYLDVLSTVISEEGGKPDYVDALTVGIDAIKRRLAEKADPEKYLKRLMLFSDFEQEIRQVSADFAAGANAVLEDLQISVEVFAIDVASKGTPKKIDLKEQMKIEKAAFYSKIVRSEMELYSLFPTKPVSSVTLYRGPIEIGDELRLKVRIYKMTSREALPTVAPYSTRLKSDRATHRVVRDVEHKKLSDPAEPVPPEHHMRSHAYGVQYVPVTVDREKATDYVPIKGIRVKGFVREGQIPRHFFFKPANLVLPEAEEGSQVALSGLARACHEEQKAMLVQCCLRKGSHVFLGVMSPFLDPDHHPDAFILNAAPFEEDVRDFSFPSFSSREALLPSEEQLEILGQIQEKDARMEVEEEIYTEAAANPFHLRYHAFLGKRSIEELTEDGLMQMVFPSEDRALSPELEARLSTYNRISKKQKTQTEGQDSDSETPSPGEPSDESFKKQKKLKADDD